MSNPETQESPERSGATACSTADRWTLTLQIESGWADDADTKLTISGLSFRDGSQAVIDQCIARQMVGLIQMLRASGNTVSPSSDEELLEVFRDALSH